METPVTRRIEQIVFDYLLDVYLNFLLVRCIDIVKSENQNVPYEELWPLIISRYDFLSGIILKDKFSATLESYRPIELIPKFQYLEKVKLSNFYDHAGMIKVDMAKHYDNHKDEINQLGLDFKELTRICALYSYKKVRDRISESRNSDSLVLHLFTSSDINPNLNLYFSLKAFMDTDKLNEILEKKLIKQYINDYLKDYDLEIINKDRLPLTLNNSGFVIGLSSSLVYSSNADDISESFNNTRLVSGTFWIYDRKKPSFYSGDQPNNSMLYPAMTNLSKCFQINLKYQDLNGDDDEDSD
jgi:hypothetical protein